MSLWERFKQLPEQYRAGSLFLIIAVVAMVAAWYDREPRRAPKEFTAAPPISATAKLPTSAIATTSGTVQVLPKKKVSQRLTLPAAISADPTKEISATATAPPSETGTEILSVLDTATGETTISIREKEQSLFAFENRKRLGVGYGVGSRGTEVKLFGEWTFARVGNFHGGVQAEVTAGSDRGSDARAFAVLDYRF